MFLETSPQGMPFSNNHYEVERSKSPRRQEDRHREKAHQERARNPHSLLELEQIICLDLQLDEMLLQIAQKGISLLAFFRPRRQIMTSAVEELPPVHCQTEEDCLKSEGSIFTVSFPGMTRDTGEK